MVNEDESNLRSFLDELVRELAPDILRATLVPTDQRTLINLIEQPEVEFVKAKHEDIMRLTDFVAANLTYDIKPGTTFRKDGFMGKTFSDLMNQVNVDMEIYKNAFICMSKDLFSYVDVKFDPKNLSDDKKREYLSLLTPIYGEDPLERVNSIPIRFKEDVIRNPGKYLAPNMENVPKDIFERHEEKIIGIFGRYFPSVKIQPSASAQKTPEGKKDLEEIIPINIAGAPSQYRPKSVEGTPEDIWLEGIRGKIRRFWHTNPISAYGLLLHRAKLNRKRLAKGKIDPWKNTFEVNGSSYDLEDPEKLKNLPDKDKMFLGMTYKSRKVVMLAVVVSLLGWVDNIASTGTWAYDKYIKGIHVPKVSDYMFSCVNMGDIAERTRSSYTPQSKPLPTPPAPTYTEAGCRKQFPCPTIPSCPDPVYTEEVCNGLYPPQPRQCPPQRKCDCEGRIVPSERNCPGEGRRIAPR